MFDLGDPGLAVCHPTVLALFSDNFDKQTLDDLTMEVLESDLVDSTIYLERLEGVPVARVASAHGLLATERLLLQRWFHPQVITEAAGLLLCRWRTGRGAGWRRPAGTACTAPLGPWWGRSPPPRACSWTSPGPSLP